MRKNVVAITDERKGAQGNDRGTASLRGATH